MGPHDKHTHDTIEIDRTELDQLIKKSTPPPPPPPTYVPIEWDLPSVIIIDDDGEY